MTDNLSLQTTRHDHQPTPQAASEKDPVYGMIVDPATAKFSTDHAGMKYHFCSAGCQTKFGADPQRYLTPAALTAAPADTGAIYT